jgi:hypothetical protein
MELGLYTFADVHPGISPERRLRDLVEEMELADQVGLDVFGVGEHHRPDFAVSSPIVPLAAGAARTERIRLTSAVTVLSSDDPVRVFQDFATLDLLSGGRAETIAGRGLSSSLSRSSPAPPPGPAAGLVSGRRHAGVGRARRDARLADGARDHRRAA